MDFIERVNREIPLGRLANKNEYHGALVFLLSDEEKRTTLQSVDQLNGSIADDLLLEQRFADYIATWKPVMDTWIQPYQGKYLPGLFKRGLLPALITKKKKLLYTNLIRCEAHRDILINTINPTQ